MSTMFKCARCGHEYQYPWQLRCPACGGVLREVDDV
jgi:hypothetical protein